MRVVAPPVVAELVEHRAPAVQPVVGAAGLGVGDRDDGGVLHAAEDGGKLNQREPLERHGAERVVHELHGAQGRRPPDGRDRGLARGGVHVCIDRCAVDDAEGDLGVSEIRESLDYGVIKMNIDTDTQYAFTRPVVDHMLKNYEGVLKIDGEVGNKKLYDPRAWGKAAEAGMAARVVRGCEDLRSTGTSSLK